MPYPLISAPPCRGRTVTLISIVAACLGGLGASVTAAERDAASVSFSQLLPDDAVVYLHLPDAAQLRADLDQTSVGRMFQDPQLRPLVEQTIAAAERAFEPVREQFGLSLMEWLRLPQRELGFAVVPIDGADPAVLLMLTAADDDRSIELLLDRGRKAALAAGMIEESETIGDVRLTVLRTAAGRSRQVLYLRRAGRLLVSTHRDAAKRALELWNGAASESLADHPPFVTLERLVGRAEGLPAQASWYVDPINLVRHSTRGNTGVQVGLAVLPALGLDGVAGLGGSIAFQHEQFEQIAQAYVLLDVPRAGAVELIALRPTTLEPEPWVFDDLTSYAEFTWDFERTYHELRKLVDGFQGEGAFRRFANVERLRERGLDLEQDVVAKVTGRVCWVTALERPLTPLSRGQLVGIQFGDAAQAEKIAKQLVEMDDRESVTRPAAGRKYYELQPRNNPFDERPRPAIAALDDFLLLSDRSDLVERAFAAADDEKKRLSGSLDFKLIKSKARRHGGDDGPGYFSFNRPEEEIRFLHGLLRHDRSRESLRRGGERNPFLRDFEQALVDRPPPPFETLQKYFAPGGAIIVDEPTGLRFLSFTLRRTTTEQP